MGGLQTGDSKGKGRQVMQFQDMIKRGSQIWRGIGKGAVKVKQYRFDCCGLRMEFSHDGKPSCS